MPKTGSKIEEEIMKETLKISCKISFRKNRLSHDDNQSENVFLIPELRNYFLYVDQLGYQVYSAEKAVEFYQKRDLVDEDVAEEMLDAVTVAKTRFLWDFDEFGNYDIVL